MLIDNIEENVSCYRGDKDVPHPDGKSNLITSFLDKTVQMTDDCFIFGISIDLEVPNMGKLAEILGHPDEILPLVRWLTRRGGVVGSG